MKTLGKCEGLWLCVAVATLTAMPAWADGELDTTFGTNGVVKINFPNSSLGYLRDAAVVNGSIVAAGYLWTDAYSWAVGSPVNCPYPDLFVVKLSLTGAIIGSPNTYPQNAIGCPTGLVVDPESGDIVVAGIDGAARFDEKGTLLASAPTTRRGCEAPGILDSHRRYVIPCTNFAGPRPPFFKNPWPSGVSLLALDTTGDPLTFVIFGEMAYGATDPMHEHLYAESIVQDAASGDYYVGGHGGWCPPSNPDCIVSNLNLVVLRFDGTSGAHDTTYGSGAGAAFSSGCGSPVAMTLDDADDLVVAGFACIARFEPTGALDTTFGQHGLVQFDTGIADARTDLLRRIYVLQIANGLLRLNADGTRDASFASNTNIGALIGDNSRWQALKFTDSSQSSAYLLGGVLPCDGTCTTPATTALMAKVMLVSDVSGSGGGGTDSGGGGSVGLVDLFWMLCLGFARAIGAWLQRRNTCEAAHPTAWISGNVCRLSSGAAVRGS